MTQGAQGQEGRGAEPAWRLLLGQGAEEDEKTESQHCLMSAETMGNLRQKFLFRCAQICPWVGVLSLRRRGAFGIQYGKVCEARAKRLSEDET